MQAPEQKHPEIIVFAGPNGSGKTTVARMAKVIEPYFNYLNKTYAQWMKNWHSHLENSYFE